MTQFDNEDYEDEKIDLQEEVEEFLIACKHTNRSIDEQLALEIADNLEDRDHLELIASLARTQSGFFKES